MIFRAKNLPKTWIFLHRLIDLVCHRAAKDISGQSAGGYFSKMLFCDWPKPTYAARWNTRSISRYENLVYWWEQLSATYQHFYIRFQNAFIIPILFSKWWHYDTTILVFFSFSKNQDDEIWKKMGFFTNDFESKRPRLQNFSPIQSRDRWNSILAFWMIFLIFAKSNDFLSLYFFLR